MRRLHVHPSTAVTLEVTPPPGFKLLALIVYHEDKHKKLATEDKSGNYYPVWKPVHERNIQLSQI